MRACGRAPRAMVAVILASGAAMPDRAVGGADGPLRLIEGELVRVDVGKKLLIVRPTSGPPREVDVTVEAETVITASGRSRALDELKTGERITVACEGATAGSCRASRVRAGPPRHAAPPAAPK